jgi:hypothetical protein
MLIAKVEEREPTAKLKKDKRKILTGRVSK